MERITYKPTVYGDFVFLGSKRVGLIKRVESGWAYFPKGRKEHGQVFQTVPEVKQSIETE